MATLPSMLSPAASPGVLVLSSPMAAPGMKNRVAAPGGTTTRPGVVVDQAWVPAERRYSQASTTRLAMPASAALPQARGSYCFLLPTSPSIFSTPS